MVPGRCTRPGWHLAASLLGAAALLGSVAFTGPAAASTPSPTATVSPEEAASSFPPVPGDPPAPPGQDPRSPRPDIVAIVLDDIPELDGRLWRRLPNIRRLFVDQGTAFVDAHGETPTCAPGRAGLLTGLHTHDHGVSATDDGTLFQPGETIATELQGVGYHTIEVGKYLNLFERIYPKWPPGWDEFHGYGGAYYDYTLWSDGRPRRHGHRPRDYSTDVISNLAVRSIKRAPQDQPLFAWIAPYAMHKPWAVAPRHRQARGCALPRWKPPGYMEADVSDKPAYVRSRRVKQAGGYELKRICRGLLSVDQLVGRVARTLRELDRLDDTLLILTADNGMTFGSQRILDDKKSPYASQVPLHMRWPRILGWDPPDVTERVQNIDLAPTLCDIAGCRLGPYPTGQARPDGRSFLKLLTGQRQALDRDVVLTSYQDSERRMPGYWSVTSTASSPLARQGCATRRSGGCRWMYTEYETGEVELYDVSNGPCYAWKQRMSGDPCMLANRAGQRRVAGIQAALAVELDRLRGDRMPFPRS